MNFSLFSQFSQFRKVICQKRRISVWNELALSPCDSQHECVYDIFLCMSIQFIIWLLEQQRRSNVLAHSAWMPKNIHNLALSVMHRRQCRPLLVTDLNIETSYVAQIFTNVHVEIYVYFMKRFFYVVSFQTLSFHENTFAVKLHTEKDVSPIH